MQMGSIIEFVNYMTYNHGNPLLAAMNLSPEYFTYLRYKTGFIISTVIYHDTSTSHKKGHSSSSPTRQHNTIQARISSPSFVQTCTKRVIKFDRHPNWVQVPQSVKVKVNAQHSNTFSWCSTSWKSVFQSYWVFIKIMYCPLTSTSYQYSILHK